MTTFRIAVRLRAPDPAARTARLALSRVMPAECPAILSRYDLWEFDVESGGLEVVEAILGRYPDILNPNKQESLVLGGEPLPGEDASMTWVSVEISDRDSGSSAGWSSVIGRAGFPVAEVRCKVLWILGYPGSATTGEVLEKAGAVAVSVTRSRGLLSNPVSQTARIFIPERPGSEGSPGK
ncbi:hypothetical protein GX411_06230 [Candidatus Fermentibacteria bacterium]|nr:hypothetical protein [Candidatus Fermentibacteria bacterium]